MLTINPVTSKSRAKDYYSVADYYTEGQETVGDWGGKLAAEWGLSGRVTQEAFDRMVEDDGKDSFQKFTHLGQAADNQRLSSVGLSVH